MIPLLAQIQPEGISMFNQVVGKGSGIFSLAAAISMTVVTSSGAENLLKVVDGPNGSSIYLDLDSVKSSGSNKRFWSVSPEINQNKFNIAYVKTYTEIDCSAKLRAIRGRVYYTANGAVVNSDVDLDSPAKWYPIIPGSNGESIMSIVCDKN